MRVVISVIALLLGVACLFAVFRSPPDEEEIEEFSIYRMRESVEISDSLDKEFLVVAQPILVTENFWVVQIKGQQGRTVFNALSSRPLTKGDQVFVRVLTYTMSPSFASSIYAVK